jgi:predicted amidophosphoribosyltransferase
VTIQLQQIDDQNRSDHHLIEQDDVCFYLFEYTSRQGYGFSKTNSLISNLKKKPSQRNQPHYVYKGRAITECASALGPAINSRWLSGAVLVPMPPSKIKTDPEYDDRVAQICRSLQSDVRIDVRELLVQTANLRAAHESDQRPTVEEIKAVYKIDEPLSRPEPTRIGIVDDVLTAGAHFRAAKQVLLERFPAAHIVGFFIARRVFANPFETEELAIFD